MIEKPRAEYLFLTDDKEWNLFISKIIWPAGTKYHPAIYREQYFVLYGRTLGWSSKSFPLYWLI